MTDAQRVRWLVRMAFEGPLDPDRQEQLALIADAGLRLRERLRGSVLAESSVANYDADVSAALR